MAAIARKGSADLGNNAGAGGTWTKAYTVNAASNFLVCCISGSYGSGATVSVTYAGSALTIVSEPGFSTGGDQRWTGIAYLANPATGSNNFVFTGSGGSDNYVLAVAADYSNVSGLDGAVAKFTSANADVTSLASNSNSLSNANSWIVGCLGGGTLNSVTNTAMTGVVYGTAFNFPYLFDTNAVVGSTGVFSNTYDFSSAVAASMTLGIQPTGGAYTASLSESGTGADSPTYIFGVSYTLAEAGSAADSPTDIYGTLATLAETGSASDSETLIGYGLSLAESGSASDTPSATATATLAEVASAADSSAITASTVSLAEGATSVDTVSFSGESTSHQTLVFGTYPGWIAP